MFREKKIIFFKEKKVCLFSMFIIIIIIIIIFVKGEWHVCLFSMFIIIIFLMTFFFFCQIPITSFLGMLKRGFTSILKLLQCNHCQKNFFVLLLFVIVESLDMHISHVQGTL